MPAVVVDLDAALRRLTHAVCSSCGTVDPPVAWGYDADGAAVATHAGCDRPCVAPVHLHGVLPHAEQLAVVHEAMRLRALAYAPPTLGTRPTPRFVDVDLTPKDEAADAGKRVIA